MDNILTYQILIIVVAFLIILPLVLLPSIIAYRKKHRYLTAIIITNIVGVFAYGLGWIIALVWCFIEPKNPEGTLGHADEIKKLFELKEKGVITQDEFDKKKKDLIS